MLRMKADTKKDWELLDGRRYQHCATGIEIVYRPNEWLWEIIGGRYDGHRFERLWAAQHHAVGGLR